MGNNEFDSWCLKLILIQKIKEITDIFFSIPTKENAN